MKRKVLTCTFFDVFASEELRNVIDRYPRAGKDIVEAMMNEVDKWILDGVVRLPYDLEQKEAPLPKLDGGF